MDGNKGKTILIHGHRGSRGTHPENTFAAFTEAIAVGINFIEIDVHLCGDGTPVVIHDPAITAELYRRKNGDPITAAIPVAQLSLKEVKEYDAGAIRNPRFSAQVASAGETIPTLEEVLIWLKGRSRLNVEIKREGESPTAEHIANQVVNVIAKHGLIKETLIQSFDLAIMAQVQHLAPDGIRAMLFESKADYIAESLKVSAHFVSPDYQLVTDSLVAVCHKNGLKITPWTVNEEVDWKRLIDWGVDGIITDYPRRLKAFLGQG